MDQNNNLEFRISEQFNVAPVPYHTHNRTNSPAISYPNLVNKTRYLLYIILGPTTNATVAPVGNAVVMPFSGIITDIGATVDVAGVTNNLTVNVNKNGTSIFASNAPQITVLSGKTTSRPSDLTLPISVNSFVLGDVFTFNITVIQSTPSMGLTIFMNLIEN